LETAVNGTTMVETKAAVEVDTMEETTTTTNSKEIVMYVERKATRNTNAGRKKKTSHSDQMDIRCGRQKLH
jgi:hypothetical protein